MIHDMLEGVGTQLSSFGRSRERISSSTAFMDDELCRTNSVERISSSTAFMDDELCRTNSVANPNKKQRRNEDQINNDLIISLIQWTDQEKILGAIFVFLPGPLAQG